MLINLRILSSFSGDANGMVQITCDDSQKISEIIEMFCNAKRIPVKAHYAVYNSQYDILENAKLVGDYDFEDNQLLTLGSIEDEGKAYDFGNWFILASIALFFSIIGLSITITIYILLTEIPDSYGFVLDAGSTHTEAILYKWHGKVNNTGLVDQMDSCHINGGIANQPLSNISEYLKTCYQHSESLVPAELLPNTEVFLGATAGMRLLREKDEEKANLVMKKVREFFSNSEFFYRDSNIKILSGTEEGIYGWITINYLQNTLNESWTPDKTMGALDLGGASTQISLEVENSQYYNATGDVVSLKLFGHKIDVFSQSFLCYGVAETLNRYRLLLSVNSQDLENITSPCEPKGFRKEVNFTQILDSPCANRNINYSIPLNATLVFIGSSDYESCNSNLTYILTPEFCTNLGLKYCIDSSNLPSGYQDKEYQAFSAFGYVVENLQLSSNPPRLEFLRKVKAACALSIKNIQVLITEKTKSSLSFLDNLCFESLYAYNLLTKFYKFDSDERWNRIKFSNEINGKSVGWSFGFMVNATERINPQEKKHKLTKVPFGLLIVAFIIFFVISLVFFRHAIKIRKSKSYQRKITKNMDEEMVKFI